jgi:hypothetical protein
MERIIELASELAHVKTMCELNITEEEMYKESGDVLFYKEDVQDVFNEWYDYYLTGIEKFLVDKPEKKNYLMNVVAVYPEAFQWAKPSGGWDEIGFDYQIVEQ